MPCSRRRLSTAPAIRPRSAAATAAPSIRQSLRQMEAAIAGAMDESRRPLPRDGYRYEAPPPGGERAPPESQPPADDDDDDGAPW